MLVIPYGTSILQRHRHAETRRSTRSQYLTNGPRLFIVARLYWILCHSSTYLACWTGSTGKEEPYRFRLSSSISLYVLQLKRRKAAIMRSPPIMAAGERGSPVRNQSTIATRKIVRLGSVSACKMTNNKNRGLGELTAQLRRRAQAK